jgi:cytochrome P450
MARWMKKPPPRCAAAWRPLPPPRVPPAGRHGHERDPHQPRPVSALDPFSAEFRADPFAAYAELRATGPIVWLEQYGIWVVQHHAQVKDVLTDWRRFSNAGGGGLTNYFKEPNWRQPSIILEVDPPEHERTRKVMMRVINANAIKSLRGGFEAVARRLVDAALAQGEIEAISQLVQPFPLTVFPDAVGMPPLDRDIMLVYGGMVFGAFGPRTAWYDQLMERAEEVSAWIDAHCARAALTDDGLGAGIYAAADAGEITHDEARLLVRSFLSAGVDTTIDSIGLALRALASIPNNGRCCAPIPRSRAMPSKRRRAMTARRKACFAPPRNRSNLPGKHWHATKRCWC